MSTIPAMPHIWSIPFWAHRLDPCAGLADTNLQQLSRPAPLEKLYWASKVKPGGAMQDKLALGLNLPLLTGVGADKGDLNHLGCQAASIRGLSYRPVASQVVSQAECATYLLRLLDKR